MQYYSHSKFALLQVMPRKIFKTANTIHTSTFKMKNYQYNSLSSHLEFFIALIIRFCMSF